MIDEVLEKLFSISKDTLKNIRVGSIVFKQLNQNVRITKYILKDLELVIWLQLINFREKLRDAKVISKKEYDEISNFLSYMKLNIEEIYGDL